MTPNQLAITFSNMLDSSFTFGNTPAGWPDPDMSQDMVISQGLSSPLTANNQTLIIAQDSTAIDNLKNLAVIPTIAANPSGCVSTSVVWTNYTAGVRFGIQASIQVSRLDSLAADLANFGSVVGFSPPNADFSWAYMIDSSPDQPVNWITVEKLANPVTALNQANSKYQLFITPTITGHTLAIQAQIQLVS